MITPVSSSVVHLGTEGLDPEDVLAVARSGVRVALSAEATGAINTSRAFVDEAVHGDEPVYGITTGFGSLAHTMIPADRLADLQLNLIRSHAAGMGAPVEPEVVRAMMLLRARTLAMGYSGARLEVVQQLVDVLNAGIVPVVPEHGSLGASGDLAPLAHAAMCLIGEGEVLTADGGTRPAADALADHGIAPLTLHAKDGLALINGTDGILGMLVMACADLRMLLGTAEVAAAMSVEGLLGTNRPFAADLVGLRPHPGQAVSAAGILAMLEGSRIVASHRYDDPRVQDAYSLRCAPQVVGAARDALAHAEAVARRELRSAIDNPMVMADGRIESGGNFHSAPLAHAADFLAIVATDVGALAERRTDRMLDPDRSEGLPAFLTPDPGVNSGLMIAHYTMAAMVAANRTLATPASTDSLPTSAGQEDHVSMGWWAVRKLRTIVGNLGRIIAVEILAASRALDFRAPLEPGVGTAAVRDLIREHVPVADGDRFVSTNLATAETLVREGAILAAAESAVGSWIGP
jgi:histidine ammonia-lyase